MHTGRIKKVVFDRGFGFIHDRDGREVFFHQSGLIDIQIKDLKNDQEVSFEVEKAHQGPRAFNIRLVVTQ